MSFIAESYAKTRKAYLARLRCLVGSQAEDVLHDAMVEIIERHARGKNSKWWKIARWTAAREMQRQTLLCVGLDVRTLGQASCLADAYERKRAAELAKRVLSRRELEALLDDYERRPPAEIEKCVRLAKKKLRKAWKLEPNIATHDGYAGCA